MSTAGCEILQWYVLYSTIHSYGQKLRSLLYKRTFKQLFGSVFRHRRCQMVITIIMQSSRLRYQEVCERASTTPLTSVPR